MPTPNHHLTHPSYRADIDGLRAIAVLSVVGYHAFPDLITGGFIGVDIFFVISGFLISTIIYGSLERDAFSFTQFYANRIRRIFPALILVLATCFIFGWLALFPDEYKQLGKHMAGGAGFVSNIMLYLESGYFDSSVESKPLLHLWSLGIEEQFYILWPLILWRAWKKSNLLAITAVIAIASFILNIYFVGSDRAAAFYLPLTRFWELLSGAMLAYVMRHHNNIVNKYFLLKPNIMSSVGVLLITLSIILINKQSAFPGGWALLPVFGTVLLIGSGSTAWINSAVLSNRAFVWVGLISYPLYLWHWPLFSFAHIVENEPLSMPLRFSLMIASFLLAWLTYQFIEKPFRFGKFKKTSVPILTILMVVIAGVGYHTYSSNGVPLRRDQTLQTGTVDAFEYETLFYINDYGRKAYPHFLGYYNIKTKDTPPTLQILGDSHANRLIMGLNKFTNENILQLSNHKCPILFGISNHNEGSCEDFTNQALAVAENTDSIKTVIIAFSGTFYLGDSAELHFSSISNPELIEPKDIFRVAIKNTLDKLIEKNKKVIVVLDNPALDFDASLCTQSRPMIFANRISALCAIPRRDFEKQQQVYRRLITDVLKAYPSVLLFDSAGVLCDDQWCYGTKNGKVLYSDRHHLSRSGSELVGESLSKLIEIHH